VHRSYHVRLQTQFCMKLPLKMFLKLLRVTHTHKTYTHKSESNNSSCTANNVLMQLISFRIAYQLRAITGTQLIFKVLPSNGRVYLRLTVSQLGIYDHYLNFVDHENRNCRTCTAALYVREQSANRYLSHTFLYELIDLRPCHHDNGYMDDWSQIKVHTNERTQIHT